MSTDYLPPGVHPADQSLPAGAAHQHPAAAVASDPGHVRYRQGNKPWSVPNEAALGTFQRLSGEWDVRMVVVDQNNGGVDRIVGRTPGRTRLTLWVPTVVLIGGAPVATPAGVIIAPDPGQLQNPFTGVILNVGDSMAINSEGSVYAGLIPGGAIPATQGFVCVIHCYDAPGSFYRD